MQYAIDIKVTYEPEAFQAVNKTMVEFGYKDGKIVLSSDEPQRYGVITSSVELPTEMLKDMQGATQKIFDDTLPEHLKFKCQPIYKI